MSKVQSLRIAQPAIVGCSLVATATLAACGAISKQPHAGSHGPAAALPQRLVGLERKMERFHLASVDVSFREARGLSPALARHARKLALTRRRLDSHGVVEIGFRHRVARFRGVERGHPVTTLLAHGATYITEPWLSRMDGGRPWARSGQLIPPHGPAKLELGPRLLFGGPTFAFLRSTIAKARSVRYDGQTTIHSVHDWHALHFTATFVAPGASLSGALSPRIRERGTLQLFVAPTGQPIEAIGVVNDGTLLRTTVSTLLSDDRPVVVTPPSPSRTIGQHELARIERRRPGAKPHILVIKG